MMEFGHILSLTFLFVLNIFFFLSGICLNSLVIISFWRSALLRKKLCYFMIMVLSCLDLLVVLTNHPLLATVAILWMTRDLNGSLVRDLSDYCSFFLNFVISYSVVAIIFFIIFTPPMWFLNSSCLQSRGEVEETEEYYQTPERQRL